MKPARYNAEALKLQQLRYVLAVTERGSLRNAAEQLGFLQTAMSRGIRELERELGVDLFERSHAGMKLTHAGSLFIRRAQAVQAEISRIMRDVDEVRCAAYGKLTVGFSTAAHVALMPEMLRSFHSRFPRTRLRIIEGLLPAMETNLRCGLVDLYFGAVSATFNPGSLEVEPLFENPRMIIARCGHPLSRARSIDELANASWVTTPVIVDTDNEVKALFDFVNLPPPSIIVEAESWMSIFTIVANTDLVAPVPRAWQHMVDTVGLVEQIPLNNLPNGPDICSVRQPGALLSPAADYFNRLARRAAHIHLRNSSDTVARPKAIPFC